MYNVDIEGLTQLIQEGRAGADYAWENRSELIARKHTYTLYGPHSPSLGASIPSSIVPAKVRQLRKSTRRKNYIIYELDDSYKPLRTILMLDYTKCDCIFHHFELNGVTYAYAFTGNERPQYRDVINVLKYQKGKPIYYANTTATSIFAESYEYTEQDRMCISCYNFMPKAKYTQFGYPVDWSAPIGAENSPVSYHCREEPVQYIDFSHWFEEK